MSLGTDRHIALPAREDGFTLIELLVAITIFIAILGITLTVLSNAAKGVKKDEVRTDAALAAQQGLGLMVRELREAYAVVEDGTSPGMGPNYMDVYAKLRGNNVRLRYDCDVAFTPDDPNNPYDQFYRRCVRRTAAVTDPTSTTPPALPAISAGTVILDRICPGTSTTSCDSAAAAPVFKCRTSVAAPSADCGRLPDPPVDPDDPPTPGEVIDPTYPTLVEINVQVPARGGTKDPIYSHRISFSDGVLLRNLDLRYDSRN